MPEVLTVAPLLVFRALCRIMVQVHSQRARRSEQYTPTLLFGVPEEHRMPRTTQERNLLFWERDGGFCHFPRPAVCARRHCVAV